MNETLETVAQEVATGMDKIDVLENASPAGLAPVPVVTPIVIGCVLGLLAGGRSYSSSTAWMTG
ncbi:MAG: hypothetical protein R3F11_03010 [Verrucomicrobiales bacterium]